MGPDPRHILEVRARDSEDAVFHFDEVFGHDVNVSRDQSIQHRKDTPCGRVLDRHHQPVHLTGGYRLEGSDKTGIPNALLGREQFLACPVAV